MRGFRRIIRCVLGLFDFTGEMYGSVDEEQWRYWSHMHHHTGQH